MIETTTLTDRERAVIDEAREMWRKRCAAYLDEHGDRGTCVLGAGVAAHPNPRPAPRRGWREPTILIGQHEVTDAQGSLVWEHSVTEVLMFLRANGIGCEYSPGRMD